MASKYSMLVSCAKPVAVDDVSSAGRFTPRSISVVASAAVRNAESRTGSSELGLSRETFVSKPPDASVGQPCKASSPGVIRKPSSFCRKLPVATIWNGRCDGEASTAERGVTGNKPVPDTAMSVALLDPIRDPAVDTSRKVVTFTPPAENLPPEDSVTKDEKSTSVRRYPLVLELAMLSEITASRTAFTLRPATPAFKPDDKLIGQPHSVVSCAFCPGHHVPNTLKPVLIT